MTRIANFFEKRLKIGPYGLAAAGIILFAVGLRVLLLALGYREGNSDESTMGIEAMHIAFNGQHPIYFYGQDYMGVLEAYLAAPLFRLFGVSAFTLRIGLVGMFLLFMVAMYWLVSRLYSKKWAVCSLALLSLLGTSDVLAQELTAVGGAVETLLFGAVLFLVAFWLASTAGAAQQGRGKGWRYAGYALWGLVAGLGLWVHLLVAPFILLSGVVILVFCRREWKSAALIFVLLGLIIGAFPLIIYNITAPPGHNAVSTFLSIHNSDAVAQSISHVHSKQVISTFLWGLPVEMGFTPSVCPLVEVPYYGPFNAATVPCNLLRGGWSLGYLALLTMALLAAASACRRLWKEHKQRQETGEAWSDEQQREGVIQFTRLALTLTAALTLFFYVSSPLVALKPWSTRYMIGLLITIPTLLWPLWNRAGLENWRPNWRKLSFKFAKPGRVLKSGALALVGLVFLISLICSLREVPNAQALDVQQSQLVQDLEKIGVKHVYTQYWTCYNLAFQSQERIICAMPDYPREVGSDRYAPYTGIVHGDPNAASMFPLGSGDDVLFAKRAAQLGKHYKRYVFDGQVVFIPV